MLRDVSYTDWTLIVNGELVPQPLYEFNALDGAWHSVSMTWDSATGVSVFYLDGVMMSTHTAVAMGASIPTAGAVFKLAEPRWGDCFYGMMDNVAFFSDVVSVADLQLMTGLTAVSAGVLPSSPVSTQLAALLARTQPVLLYTFDDESLFGAAFESVADVSGQNHHASFSTAASGGQIVPSSAPGLWNDTVWITVPTGVGAQLVTIILAATSNCDAVSITGLPSSGTIYHVLAGGLQGAAVANGDPIASFDGVSFAVMALFATPVTDRSRVLQYSTTPAAALSQPVFHSRLVFQSNSAPLPLSRMEITVDQGVSTTILTYGEIYPGQEQWTTADPDGDPVVAWVVQMPAMKGRLFQVANNLALGAEILASQVSLDTPVKITHPYGLVSYVAPTEEWGTRLDSFATIVSDRYTWTNQTSTKYFTVVRLPRAPSVNVSSPPVVVEEGHSTVIQLPIDNAALGLGDFAHVLITALPQKGRLFQLAEDGVTKGEEILLSPGFGSISQWVNNVTRWSSYYEDLSGGWSAQQIIGPPNAWPIAGDNVLAWASATTDTAEWLEMTFAQPVFVSQVEIFENFNPNHVAKVMAKNTRGAWQTLWQGETDPAVPAAAGTRAHVQVPSLCPVSFASNGIRLELTSAGASWAEIDAVRMTGSTTLAANIVRNSQGLVLYEANPLAAGADSFEFTANGCEYFTLYRDLGIPTARVNFAIQYFNHPPQPLISATPGAGGDTWFSDSAGLIPSILLAGTDPDAGANLTMHVLSLPQHGELFVGAGAAGSAVSSALPLVLPYGTILSARASEVCFYEDQDYAADSFTFLLSDGIAQSTPRTVQLRYYCLAPASVPSGVSIAVFTLMSLGVACLLLIFVIFTARIHSPVVKATTYSFSVLAQVACAGLYLSMLPFVLPVTDGVCLARWWLPCCSLTLLLAAVFSKTQRIARIFNAQRLAVVRMRNSQVGQWVVAQLAVTLLLLALYSGIDAPKLYFTPRNFVPAATDAGRTAADRAADAHVTYAGCTSQPLFQGLLFGYQGALIAWGTWLAVSVRNVSAAFNEAQSLGASIYNILFVSLLGVSLDFLIADAAPTSHAVLRCMMLFVGTSVVVCVLFGTKLWMLRGAAKVNPTGIHAAAKTVHEQPDTVLSSHVGAGTGDTTGNNSLMPTGLGSKTGAQPGSKYAAASLPPKPGSVLPPPHSKRGSAGTGGASAQKGAWSSGNGVLSRSTVNDSHDRQRTTPVNRRSLDIGAEMADLSAPISPASGADGASAAAVAAAPAAALVMSVAPQAQSDSSPPPEVQSSLSEQRPPSPVRIVHHTPAEAE